jgi:HD superfamily phosphodiesterase
MDPSGEVDLEDLEAVKAAICSTLDRVYGLDYDAALLREAVDALGDAYRGEAFGFLRSDTPYHDLRHVLETGLTMARLIEAQASVKAPAAAGGLDSGMALLGVLLALFHDIGLLRRADEAHLAGATLTPIHEERGVEFLQNYLARTELAALAEKSELIMPTKLTYSIPVGWSAQDRLLASLVASADLISQMADRCYLEKCWHFLFNEFCTFGVAGTPDSPYPDRETLMIKSPRFFADVVTPRLDQEFGGVRRLLDTYYSGADPYQKCIQANVGYLENLLSVNDFSRLRRRPTPFVGDHA